MYNGKFKQCLNIEIESDSHEGCLIIAKSIKKQCDAWYFNVEYRESKGSRKGPVLSRSIMIYQTAYAGDIVIFKEAVRRICFYYSTYGQKVEFIDRGSEPINDLRQSARS